MNESLNLKDTCTSEELASLLGEHLLRTNQRVTTAESCTGGLIAGAITDVAGSSEWFEQGAVTYSNAAKRDMLGVNASVFEEHGAVSDECVQAMAIGALSRSGADVAISVSGIAGPGGATPGKPVGTVWIAWAMRMIKNGSPENDRDVTERHGKAQALQTHVYDVESEVFYFAGDRRMVRRQAVYKALRGTLLRISTAEQL